MKKTFTTVLLLVLIASLSCRSGGLDQKKPDVYVAPTPLIAAIYEADLEEVQRLVANGADVNEENLSHGMPLMAAVQMGGRARKIKQFLIESGAHAGDLTEHYSEIENFSKHSGDYEKVEPIARMARLRRTTLVSRGPNTDMHELHMDEGAARALVNSNRTEMLKKGWFLFHIGLGKNIESGDVGIIHTQDKYAIIAFITKNNHNHRVVPFKTIRWLKELEKDEPFELRAVGESTLVLKFRNSIQDSALLERVNEVYPVADESGTESALHAEFVNDNSLLLAWE